MKTNLTEMIYARLESKDKILLQEWADEYNCTVSMVIRNMVKALRYNEVREWVLHKYENNDNRTLEQVLRGIPNTNKPKMKIYILKNDKGEWEIEK